MSALGQKRTLLDLFDHLVRASLHRRRHVDAECLGRREIDQELEPCRLLDWKFTRLGSLQYLVSVSSCTATDRHEVRSIRQERPGRQSLATPNRSGEAGLKRQLPDKVSLRVRQTVSICRHGLHPGLSHSVKGGC